MRNVFLDTVGLLAVREKSDQWHEAALQAMREFAYIGTRTWSSDSVFLECGNAVARKPYRDEFVAMRRDLVELGSLVTPSEVEVEMAWEAYEKRHAAGAGIVDQISFVLMRRLGINEAVTNDEHFHAAGFVT
ncbi:MAG: PIN domain-containing protein [Aureliella sp.]